MLSYMFIKCVSTSGIKKNQIFSVYRVQIYVRDSDFNLIV